MDALKHGAAGATVATVMAAGAIEALNRRPTVLFFWARVHAARVLSFKTRIQTNQTNNARQTYAQPPITRIDAVNSSPGQIIHAGLESLLYAE